MKVINKTAEMAVLDQNKYTFAFSNAFLLFSYKVTSGDEYDKYSFLLTQITYLGHGISPFGIKLDESKLSAVS